MSEIYIKLGGIINLREYARILDTNLACSAKKLKLKNYIFQQDNGSKHTSKHVSKYLIDRNINTMIWPAQSPDLNYL